MDINVKFHDFSHVLIECNDSIFFEMRDYFSFQAEGYQFNPKFKYGQWDGRIRLLEHNRLLPFGLAAQVKKFADTNNYTLHMDPVIFEKEALSREDFDAWLATKEIYSGLQKIEPHWYQADAVYEGIVNRRRILNLPTSAGKSLIQALMAKYYNENYEGKVLIIVPTASLVTQMHDDLIDYRLFKSSDIEMVGGSSKNKIGNNPNACICVSTWQTAVKQSKEWMSQYGMMMNDECHLAIGASITKIIAGLTNCMFKSGLSGSLRDGRANVMQYVGLFGEIFKPVSTSQLMEDGQVTDLKINSIFLRYPDEVTTAMKGKTYQEEIKFITTVKKRTKWVSKLAVKLASRDENVFLMFKNIEHGKALLTACRELHNKVYYVSGEVNTETRNTLKAMAEDGKGIIVVASYGVFSTGISVKNLHHVIFAHPVKSKIIVLQTIGRVLRKHDSKKLAQVWDLIDDLGVKPKSKTAKKKYVHLNYALKHALERIQRYAEEKFNYVMKEVLL